MRHITIQENINILRSNYRFTIQEIADYINLTRVGLYHCMKSDSISDLQINNKVINRRKVLLDLISNPNNLFKEIHNIY